MRDRIETSNNEIRAVATGMRTVRKRSVSINGREYWGSCLDALEGQAVIVRVRDFLASVYDVYDSQWNPIGDCHEPSKFERQQRKLEAS